MQFISSLTRSNNCQPKRHGILRTTTLVYKQNSFSEVESSRRHVVCNSWNMSCSYSQRKKTKQI